MDPKLLQRRVRRLELLLLLAIASIGLLAFRPQSDTMSTRLLRIVDGQGRTRFLIGAPLPDPKVQGTVYPRSRPVPGIMFLDTVGNETGGLGLFDDLQGGALCFDYATAEAVCLTKAPTLGFVGLTMLDPPATGSRVGLTGAERLQLAVVRGRAGLTVSDAQGRVRLRLSVDSLGVPEVQFLDEQGAVIRRLTGQ